MLPWIRPVQMVRMLLPIGSHWQPVPNSELVVSVPVSKPSGKGTFDGMNMDCGRQGGQQQSPGLPIFICPRGRSHVTPCLLL